MGRSGGAGYAQGSVVLPLVSLGIYLDGLDVEGEIFSLGGHVGLLWVDESRLCLVVEPVRDVVLGSREVGVKTQEGHQDGLRRVVRGWKECGERRPGLGGLLGDGAELRAGGGGCAG